MRDHPRGSCVGPRADDAEIARLLTLDQVLTEQVGCLGIPAWRGALIGHVARQLTVPIGIPVEIDATRGAIQLLEPAVT